MLAYRKWLIDDGNTSGWDPQYIPSEPFLLPLFGYRYEHDEFLLYDRSGTSQQPSFPMTRRLGAVFGNSGLCQITVPLLRWLLNRLELKDYSAVQLKTLQENVMRFLAQEPLAVIPVSGYSAGYLFSGQVDLEVLQYCSKKENSGLEPCACIVPGYSGGSLGPLDPICINARCTSHGYKNGISLSQDCTTPIDLNFCQIAISGTADTVQYSNVLASCSQYCNDKGQCGS